MQQDNQTVKCKKHLEKVIESCPICEIEYNNWLTKRREC